MTDKFEDDIAEALKHRLSGDSHLRWIKYFMNLANAVSMKSKDPSTKVGAVIVGTDNQIISTGFNGFPRGVHDKPPRCKAEPTPARFTRPDKYLYTAHAEANAVFQAARHGIRLQDCRIFVSSMPPCNECAKAIIQAGLTEVYCYPPDSTAPNYSTWEHSYAVSRTMLHEAGVQLCYIRYMPDTDIIVDQVFE
jgi:dCMP deaminase